MSQYAENLMDISDELPAVCEIRSDVSADFMAVCAFHVPTARKFVFLYGSGNFDRNLDATKARTKVIAPFADPDDWKYASLEDGFDQLIEMHNTDLEPTLEQVEDFGNEVTLPDADPELVAALEACKTGAEKQALIEKWDEDFTMDEPIPFQLSETVELSPEEVAKEFAAFTPLTEWAQSGNHRLPDQQSPSLAEAF